MPRSAVLVLFEPVRSAEPPMVSGRIGLITSSAISDALRVATLGRLVGDLLLQRADRGRQLLGFSPAKAR
jgi:hypothetical protein